MVEKDNEFWRRYPEEYILPNGTQIIWGTFDVSDMHESYINETLFEYTCWTRRQMRYKNQKGLDPQVKLFLDYEKIKLSPEWNLPVPNEQAAYLSLAKYGKAEVIMASEQINAMNKAWAWTEQQFMPYMGNSIIVSTEEAISRLDLTSSTGFPWNKLYPTKRELLEKDLNFYSWLEKDWELLATDEWTTIASSSLKEELRPQVKIDENSQRTFTAMAADATVQGNRLFVDQNEKMYASHLKTASAIGMSPLLGNWDKLYRKLNVFQNGYALDESQYDSSLRKFLVWGCGQLRWKMFALELQTPENLKRVQNYYRNLVNTLILTPEGIMVTKKLGMPSGCVNTVTDNTLMLYTLMAYAWIMNAPAEYNNYIAFEEHTAKALVGDDNTWTVSNVAHEFYNARSVISVWKTVGITTTTDCLDARPAQDLDFLSAHTVFVKGIALPLYARNKLMTSLLFAPQKRISPAVTLQRCTNLLQIGWTDLVFRKFCRDLIDWLLQEYDEVLKDDERWIVAKCGIMSDQRYFHLFSKREITFYPQSYQESQERSIKPDNKVIYQVMSTTKTTVVKQSRNTRRRVRGPKRGTKVVRKVVVQAPRRRQQQQRRRRPKNRGTFTGSTVSGKGPTSFGSSKIRTNTVVNDEYVAAISSPGAQFSQTTWSINPGNKDLFPWLSQQATQWEKYKFKKLIFYYRRVVSEYAASGSQGKVIYSIDFDASDPPPTNKQQMEDTIPHRDAMPCEDFALIVPPRMMNPVNTIGKFVRVGQIPGNSDIKTYDQGLFTVATQGVVAGEVGELRVAYEVEFSVPVLETTIGAPVLRSLARVEYGPTLIPSDGAARPLICNIVGYNALGIRLSGSGFSLPPGNYLIHQFAQIQPVDPYSDFQITADAISNDGSPSQQIPDSRKAIGWGVPTQAKQWIASTFYFSSDHQFETILLQAAVDATPSSNFPVVGYCIIHAV